MCHVYILCVHPCVYSLAIIMFVHEYYVDAVATCLKNAETNSHYTVCVPSICSLMVKN